VLGFTVARQAHHGRDRTGSAGVTSSDVSVLALDEPTAALPHKEVDLLLPMLERFAQESGQAILFVSHRLDEIVDDPHVA
jgi:ABC-type sugar transport system ATPase subunit